MERFLDGEFESTMAPSNVEVVALLESEADETALYDRRFTELFQRYQRQARSFERVGAMAPTLAARSLSMALAGTDEAHDREFAAAAARYRTAMLTTLNGELASSGRFNTFDYTRGRDLWEKVPPFDYDVPSARWALSQVSWSASALVAWLLAIAIAAAMVGLVDEARVTMVWFLAGHEWRVLKASTIVRLVIAVFAIALVVASGIGVDARDARARHNSTCARIAAASSRAAPG